MPEMRILVIHPGPDFSVSDVCTGWVEALRGLGCEIAEYNLLLNDRLIFYSMALIDTGEKDEGGHPIVRSAMSPAQAWRAAAQGISHAAYSMWPDAILFVSAFFTDAAVFALLRARGHKVVVLHTECPYQDTEQLLRAECADLNLLNDEASLEIFREAGPAVYQPHCYRPSVHYPRAGPRDPELASDLVFIGSAFASRKAFFEGMDLAGLDVLLGGADWGSLPEDSSLVPFVGTLQGAPDCVDNPQAAKLYRNSKTGLNFYRREGDDNAIQGVSMGPREVELAACGLPFLRDPRPEGDEVLSMLPRFSSPGEASEQLRWLLAHDQAREKLAIQAREAIADRTFEASARRLLKLLENL